MESANLHRPANRTFAVIEGGTRKQTGLQTPTMAPKPKLLDQVRQAIRTRHLSPHTEQAYVGWINDLFSSMTSVIR